MIFGPRGLIADRVQTADTPFRRLRGLLGRSEIGPSEALLIGRCPQVHTLGMRFAIDAVFCDRDLRVLHVSTLEPRRISRYVRRASCCIELAAGRAQACGIEPGVQLAIRSPGATS